MLAAILAWGALAVAPAAARAQHRPDAVTGTPTEVAATSATLHGVVTPNGDDTWYAFVYGATRYDRYTPIASAGAGSDPVAVSAHVEGLSPTTTYHVRLIAFSARGFAIGRDVSFATPAPAPAPAPVAPIPTPAPPAPMVTSSPSSAAPPPPVLGETVNVAQRSGRVTVKAPGMPGYVALSELTSIPVGSIINTRNGSVTLRSALPDGEVQTGIFHGGLFEVRQPKSAKGLTELRLRGAPPSCGRGATYHAATSKRKRRPLRRLWGRDNHGRFRTRGGSSVATVRGTAWYVEDRCDGTLTRVSKGSVSVRDLVRHRTVVVRAGHSYLAH